MWLLHYHVAENTGKVGLQRTGICRKQTKIGIIMSLQEDGKENCCKDQSESLLGIIWTTGHKGTQEKHLSTSENVH